MNNIRYADDTELIADSEKLQATWYTYNEIIEFIKSTIKDNKHSINAKDVGLSMKFDLKNFRIFSHSTFRLSIT